MSTLMRWSNALDCVFERLSLQITTSTHQFSVTRHRKVIRPGIGDGLPGLFIQYEFSPLLVKYTESRRLFSVVPHL